MISSVSPEFSWIIQGLVEDLFEAEDLSASVTKELSGRSRIAWRVTVYDNKKLWGGAILSKRYYGSKAACLTQAYIDYRKATSVEVTSCNNATSLICADPELSQGQHKSK
jgi:hypothetical protein